MDSQTRELLAQVETSDLRELAQRDENGIATALLWHPKTDRVFVAYADHTGETDSFFRVVPSALALDAFHHPNIYA